MRRPNPIGARLARAVLVALGWLTGLGEAHPVFAQAISAPPRPDRVVGASDTLGHHRFLSGDVAALQPLGVGTLASFNYRHVYRYSELYDTMIAYWEAGAGLAATPAYLQPSVHVDWMPAPFVLLRFEYDFYQFLGANNGLLSFPSATSPFGDDARKARHDEEAATAHRLFFQPTLRARVGPVILRNQMDLAYYRFSGRGPYVLELEYDTLLKDGDVLVSNRTEVFFELWKGERTTRLLAGPYYEVTHAGDADLTRQRLGLQGLWVPVASLGPFARPRVYAQGGINLEDPNRRHQPYLLIGVGADVDL